MPKTKSENLNAKHQQEKELYQALADGIANEEILNIKSYSNEDLRKILDYQDKLLNETSNATAFESIHENSISDLKKFADGQLSIDSDSYETMKEFIRIFGTDYKGELTPEGRAAQEKLNRLIEEKKQKILRHKIELRNQASSEKKQSASQELLNVVESVRRHKINQQAETLKKAEQEEEITEFSFGMTEEKESAKTVEYSFGMFKEEPDNTAEYSFGINNETENAQQEEEKKQQIDNKLLETSAPAVPETKEKQESEAPLALPEKEKIIIEKSAADDLLDQIISGSSDLNDDQIADILGEEKPGRKTPATPKKKQTAAPKAKAKPEKKKQPVKRSGKRNLANKIKVWGIAAAVAFCSFLGLKNNKKEYQLDMPNPTKTETKVTSQAINTDSIDHKLPQKQTEEDLWADVFEPERKTADTLSSRQLFPDVDDITPITDFHGSDDLAMQDKMQDDDLDLQYEIARNKILAQRRGR